MNSETINSNRKELWENPSIRRNINKKINPFKINTEFLPSGDQPEAIKSLVNGIDDNEKSQVLLGVTGSGKTFTMAQIIEKSQKLDLAKETPDDYNWTIIIPSEINEIAGSYDDLSKDQSINL